MEPKTTRVENTQHMEKERVCMTMIYFALFYWPILLTAIVRIRVLHLAVLYFPSVVSPVQLPVVVNFHDALADPPPNHDCDDGEHDDDNDQEAGEADDDRVPVVVLGEEVVDGC